MDKDRIRLLKTHYGVRWTAFRHNRKCSNKILPIQEKFILDNVLPGMVMAHDCLGEIYNGILDVSVELGPARTILLVNPRSFKYKTPNQLAEFLISYSDYLLKDGRIIANVDLKFLILPRLYMSVIGACEHIKNLIGCARFDVQYHLDQNSHIPHGYGQLYLILDQNV